MAATWISSSAKIISRNNRVVALVVAALVLLALVVLMRRWIHHAQLALVPVVVWATADPETIVHPPAAAIVGRMGTDIRDLFQRPARPRLAALTFDDGPYPVTTPVLVAQLEALKVPATFFLIGRDAIAQPAISIRLRAADIEVGNHTLSHLELSSLSSDGQYAEISGGGAAIGNVTGTRVTLFRPPHGNYNADTIRAARRAGETVVLWDVDPGDWRSVAPDTIVASCVKQARAPAVILLHDGKEATIEALPGIVAAYRRAGFRFVTLSQLLAQARADEINDPIRVAL